MQTSPIIVIPPTHEQSLYSFHVEAPQVTSFLEFLASKGITPWRPPVPLDKTAPDGQQEIQIEIDSESSQNTVQGWVDEFLSL